VLRETRPYAALDAKGQRLEEGFAKAFSDAGVPVVQARVGSMGTAFFTGGEVSDFAAVKRADTKRFGLFHRAMLERGVYLPPSQFEAWFLGTAHDDAALAYVIDAARESARVVAQG
jgi:glutamate-1-semialdehyde 2,1-aminomutase